MTTIDCTSNNSHISTNISTNNTETVTTPLKKIKNNLEQNGKHYTQENKEKKSRRRRKRQKKNK